MDPLRPSYPRSHVPAFNCGYPNVIGRSRRRVTIQRLTGAALNPNGDYTDELGVIRTRNGASCVVYPLSGDALALVLTVMRGFDGCEDLLCASVEATGGRFLCGRAFLTMEGVFSGMHGVS